MDGSMHAGTEGIFARFDRAGATDRLSAMSGLLARVEPESPAAALAALRSAFPDEPLRLRVAAMARHGV